jgi:hypothetical protein
MNAMVDAVETLALAAYLGGDERHAAKAARLLRAWFLDPATRMSPHLRYAQAIPGVTSGRGIGLIETRGLTRVVEAVGLLESSGSWRAADGAAIRDWFARFLRWMRESANGKDEADEPNNHGTYYDLQTASYALFTGQPDLARDVLRAARVKRIASQIEPDGRQPLELSRTRSWSYSVMNLDGLTQLAVLGERVGVDLWTYRATDGRSLRAALMYLAPYAFGERAWTHQQLGEWTPQALFPVLRRAGVTDRDAEVAGLVAKLPPVTPSDRSRLSGSR